MLTPDTLAPSADVAKFVTSRKMRFLYPLAAVLTCAVFLSPTAGEAQTASTKLRPDQQRAVEIALQQVEPAMRPMAREQLSKTFAPFSEAQIAMMMAKMEENKKAAAAKPAPVAEVERPMTPADIEYNRAQYEPVIRKHWAVQKRFDEFASAKMASHCPGRDEYARYGSGWRYEIGQLGEASSLASWNVETNVEVAGKAYAPQDGRYSFDFSKVRLTFDETAVEAAIKQACSSLKTKGKEFLAKVDPMIARQDWDGAFKLEQTAQAGVSAIRTELDAKFAQLSPGDFSAIQMAMMNGKKVKS